MPALDNTTRHQVRMSILPACHHYATLPDTYPASMTARDNRTRTAPGAHTYPASMPALDKRIRPEPDKRSTADTNTKLTRQEPCISHAPDILLDTHHPPKREAPLCIILHAESCTSEELGRKAHYQLRPANIPQHAAGCICLHTATAGLALKEVVH